MRRLLKVCRRSQSVARYWLLLQERLLRSSELKNTFKNKYL
jgi:hypothetical protein